MTAHAGVPDAGQDHAEVDVDAVGRRVEELLDQVVAAEPAVAHVAEQLVSELVELYGAGLARMVDQLATAAPGALADLAEDPLVAGLLSLHDLHPEPLDARIEAALDECRPYLASHDGGVSLVAIDEGVVRLRLEGTCDGCGASELTMTNAIESAILSAAPEVVAIDVEGTVPPGQGHAPPPGGPPESLAAATAGADGRSLPMHPGG